MKTEDKYILDAEKRIVPEHDLTKWAKWLQNPANTVVRQEHLGHRFEVSTIFVGMPDVRSMILRDLTGAPPRNLFETAVFSLNEDGSRASTEQLQRCDTWEEALAQHAAMVASLEPPGAPEAPAR